MNFRILELFSGIGGMNYAFQYATLPGCVVAAMDINTVANEVYQHNHPNTTVLNNNIQKLSAKTMHKLDVNMLLMSPPCQPHTRVGHQRDVADNRSDALTHLCALLPQCPNLQYVLMENVKGFERSQARQDFVNALTEAGFYRREFILTPTQFDVPNTRHRYYCIARKNADFPFDGEKIWQQMPPTHESKRLCGQTTIATLLVPEERIPCEMYLPEKVLDRRAWLLDIVGAESGNTMCFTKAYTHYIEGTGSVYASRSAEEIHNIFKEVKSLESEMNNTVAIVQKQAQEHERLKLLKSLCLRYFTPTEVARLMSFPESFDFPTTTTTRQKYRLLGNSINVRVVGELIKLMCSE